MCVLSHVTSITVFVTPWTVGHQAPLCRGFSRQEYWSEWPFPMLGYLPNSGIKPESLVSPAVASGFFTTSATWEVLMSYHSLNQLKLQNSHLCITP